MPRFEDFRSDPEVRDIVERFLTKFPRVFEGFSVDDIGFVVTQKKKVKGKHPIRLKTVPYPHFVFSGKTYIMETMETRWTELNPKQRNLAVFHAMCAIPIGGFDPASKVYGRVLKPDFELYRNEYAASGGVADWFEDDRATDPMEIEVAAVPVEGDDESDPIPPDDDGKPSGKFPVTAGDIVDTKEDEEEPEAIAS